MTTRDLPSHIPRTVLRDCRLFQGLQEDLLTHMGESLDVRVADVGEVIVKEGAIEAEMYIIVTGELEVLSTGGADREVRVALFGPGDWFGEMAILDVQPRSASVRAVAPSHLIAITAADMRRLVYEKDAGQYALMVMNVARELSRRLRVADRLIAQAAAPIVERYVRESMAPRPNDD